MCFVLCVECLCVLCVLCSVLLSDVELQLSCACLFCCVVGLSVSRVVAILYGLHCSCKEVVLF